MRALLLLVILLVPVNGFSQDNLAFKKTVAARSNCEVNEIWKKFGMKDCTFDFGPSLAFYTSTGWMRLVRQVEGSEMFAVPNFQNGCIEIHHRGEDIVFSRAYINPWSAEVFDNDERCKGSLDKTVPTGYICRDDFGK
jgi:hypothetical protein